MVFVIDSAALACSSFTSVLTVIPDDHRTERSGSPNCWRKRYPGVPGSPAAIEFGTVLSLRDIAGRLVLAKGKKKGHHPSPATVLRMLRDHDRTTDQAEIPD
ncbi:hypothetical protein ACLMAL_32375 [Nocardia sp. CWNU-33]|uniref:hypothetical protein n=1 Tax=Nocardia sp. CWNU-33 TaxID=3392117 RepID=UPI00398F3454